MQDRQGSRGPSQGMAKSLKYATVDPGNFATGSVRSRLRSAFTQNAGKILTRSQCAQVAGGAENWHQRLSELRTEEGYTILSNRDLPGQLKPGEYLMPNTNRRAAAAKRVRPDTATWSQVLERAKHACEWAEDGQVCKLSEGGIDPVGGGTVRLQADHRTPHSVDANTDPSSVDSWGALCGRHQVTKRNYWDDTTGKLNILAILQSASRADKELAYQFLHSILQHSTNGNGPETEPEAPSAKRTA